MTYRSSTRGIMYTAPPGPDDNENRRPESEATAEEESAAEETPADSTPELDPTTAATDANWTGNVSADD